MRKAACWRGDPPPGAGSAAFARPGRRVVAAKPPTAATTLALPSKRAATRVQLPMIRVSSAVSPLSAERHHRLELGDQAIIDQQCVVDATVVAGRSCLHDQDVPLRQFRRAGIRHFAVGLEERLYQYLPLGADILVRGTLLGGLRSVDRQ